MRFRTLRFKLTLSAAATMIVAVVVVTAVVVVLLSLAEQRLIRRADLQGPLSIEAGALAVQLAPLVSGARPAANAERWLTSRRQLCDLGLITEVETPRDGLRSVLLPLSSLVVADASGRILAGLPESSFPRGEALTQRVPPAVEPAIEAALGGETTVLALRSGDLADQVFAPAPIVDEAGELRGVVYLHASTGPLSLATLAGRVTQMLRETLPRAAPVAAIVALILAAFSTRGLVRRLERLRRASAAWAGGDFAERVGDGSGDELGALARDLDDMATQLATLIDARNQLAALEERNALARELHDTVKQNVFSVSMLLASVEGLLDTDPAQARTCLARARSAAHDTGRELVALIDQLRPAACTPGGLGVALRAQVDTWSQSHGISATLATPDSGRLPAAVERDLLLVAREALANVARHSQAHHVDVRLVVDPPIDVGTAAKDTETGCVQLSIRDDGIGFNPARVADGGFGLESMSARMAARGGRVIVDAQPGCGTTVVAECRLRRDISPTGNAANHDRAA